jgi:hypothetical protein
VQVERERLAQRVREQAQEITTYCVTPLLWQSEQPFQPLPLVSSTPIFFFLFSYFYFLSRSLPWCWELIANVVWLHCLLLANCGLTSVLLRHVASDGAQRSNLGRMDGFVVVSRRLFQFMHT